MTLLYYLKPKALRKTKTMQAKKWRQGCREWWLKKGADGVLAFIMKMQNGVQGLFWSSYLSGDNLVVVIEQRERR